MSEAHALGVEPALQLHHLWMDPNTTGCGQVEPASFQSVCRVNASLNPSSWHLANVCSKFIRLGWRK